MKVKLENDTQKNVVETLELYLYHKIKTNQKNNG